MTYTVSGGALNSAQPTVSKRGHFVFAQNLAKPKYNEFCPLFNCCSLPYWRINVTIPPSVEKLYCNKVNTRTSRLRIFNRFSIVSTERHVYNTPQWHKRQKRVNFRPLDIITSSTKKMKKSEKLYKHLFNSWMSICVVGKNVSKVVIIRLGYGWRESGPFWDRTYNQTDIALHRPI